MVKCRKEAYCAYGMAEDEEGTKDYDNKDPRRCFRCMATGYSLFENVPDDDEDEFDESQEEE